ncbi:MAG: DUF2304 family protein [Desulfobacterales bacterium]|nr:DUF2304 family protein [Desulfobacterales bacterium]
MSNLRIFGLVLGLLLLVITFVSYRGPRWKRWNFTLFTLFSLGLIAVSIDPDMLNFFRDVLSLGKASRGRIISLLILSNILCIFFIFLNFSKNENLRLQFDRLVRHLGSRHQMELISGLQPIMVLIPAFNEAENLAELLPKLPERVGDLPVGALVVDDGSEDDTASVAGGFDRVQVVKNPINRGGGAALRLGYDLLNHAGVDICITMDADGQHRPEDIENLLRPILEDRADFVIGSRVKGENRSVSPLRTLGVYVFGALISLLMGKKITDPSSGFRAFRMSAIGTVELNEDQYHTSELIIEAVKKGLRIEECPVTILKRRHGKSKKGKDWLYGIHFARIIFKTWWR